MKQSKPQAAGHCTCASCQRKPVAPAEHFTLQIAETHNISTIPVEILDEAAAMIGAFVRKDQGFVDGSSLRHILLMLSIYIERWNETHKSSEKVRENGGTV